MIVAKNISLNIGQRQILETVSVHIPLGEVTVILGPNGAGKSTLLKCLTGLVNVDQGSVEMNQKSLSGYALASLSRQRAVLSQSVPVSFPFTVAEIVQMGRAPYANEVGLIEETDITYAALACVDGLHLMNRIFPTLSGGEQQRVQLARVLAQIWNIDKAYLFLDEPTSALDLKHQHQLFNLVRQIAMQNQVGVCIVMHDLHLAKRYADQVLLMKDGKLFAAGDVNSVLTKTNIEKVFEINASLVFD